MFASLMSLGVLCAGCARPQAVLNSWLERPQDAQAKPADPGKLLKEESRNQVAANTGASTWPGWFDNGASPSAAVETPVADAEPAETGSVFAAFVRKREPAANETGDPFLAAAQYQTDAESTETGPRTSGNTAPHHSTYRPWDLAERSPRGGSHSLQDAPQINRSQPGAEGSGQLPEWGRHDLGAGNRFVNEFDSQYDRLRTAMNEDSRHTTPSIPGDTAAQSAKSDVHRLMEQARHDLQRGRHAAAYQTVLKAEALAKEHSMEFDANEQPPADLAQQIRREIDAILQVKHVAGEDGTTATAPKLTIDEPRRDSQLEDDFPWSASAAEQVASASNANESSLEMLSPPPQTAQSNEVEFLPPPPVIPPDAELIATQHDPLPPTGGQDTSADPGHPLADVETIPRAPWRTVQKPLPPGFEHNRSAPTANAVATRISEPSGRSRAEIAVNERLAMIVPHGSDPAYGSQPRVSANTAAILPQPDMQAVRPPQAMPTRVAWSEEKSPRHIAAPEPQTPDVFEQTAPSKLARVTADTGLEWDTIEDPQPAPAPPAEVHAAKPIPRALAAIDWSDEFEQTETTNKIAGLPLPMVFGIAIVVAFGIGLAIRRKTKAETA